MAFVHLHNRTQFSILDGAMRPAELAGRAAELQMGAVAVTDSCNLYGAVEFYEAAMAADIRPILGAELWLWPEGLEHLDPRAQDGGWQVVLLVENRAGYQNLCALLTDAIFDGMHYRPRADLKKLSAHSEGLIAMTSGLNGPLGTSCRGDLEIGRDRISRLAEIMGPDHLYLELHDTGLPGQPEVCERARALAQSLGLDTVVTNDCRYIEATDAVTLDLLNAIAMGQTLDTPGRKTIPTDQQYVKTEQEMRELFPDDGAAIDRTASIADRCNFSFEMGTYYFPATTPPDAAETLADQPDTDPNWAYFYQAFPPPRDAGLPGPEESPPPRPEGAGNMHGYFRWYGQLGLDKRLEKIEAEQHPVYQDRFNIECAIIEKMGFPAYLLIVAEFINWAKDHEIPVGPGRGSAAGSIVAWSMRITDIDPMRFGLLFERFLNPERVSMPDIDVDFCQDRREEVIHHVRDKYGAELVSQIITYGNLKAKAAIKDIARICGLDFNQANRIAKLVPDEVGITLDMALGEDRLRNQANDDPMVGRLISLAKRVEGMTRQTGVHAAGVVIADKPLIEHAPLYRDGPEGGPVVQFDMKSAEAVGLIKFDFLGLKTLDQIRDALALIERNTGEKIVLADLPLDDADTFQLLQRGDGLGVFQVESSGMRDLLTRLRPSTIDDLIALLALYRPGPLGSGMVDTFIDCKHGRQAVSYPHPSLEPILESTYGGIVYQEQVMQIAQVLCGYSLGEADMLRRAMGKKKKSEMDKQKKRFLAGAEANEVDPKIADDIFELLVYFAGYGFNKSHSAAYGMISYHTAWLKAHHRAEFMAALMSVEANNTDKVLQYIGDCKRAGIEVLPPDVNTSLASFDVPADHRSQIRFGLAAVKGVGEGAVTAIVEARTEAGGSFSSFMDFMERMDFSRVNKKALESLIKCGAFDWSGTPRRELFEVLTTAVAIAQQIQHDIASSQTSLFGGAMAQQVRPRLSLPDLGEWPTGVKLGMEREAVGFFVTGHPISQFADIIEHTATCTIDQLSRQPVDKEVAIAGMVSALRKTRTKKGSRMGFVTVDDELAGVECIFFSDAWALSERVLTAGQPLLIRGKLEKSHREGEETCKILAETAELLCDVRERRTRKIHLVVEHEELMPRLGALADLLTNTPGTTPVHMHLRMPDLAWVSLQLSALVVPEDELFQNLEEIFRRADVARLE
jgi:DNA polymerase-3 subunit alpha